MSTLVAPLIREHNLVLFLVVLVGLAAVATVKTTHLFSDGDRPGWIRYLTIARSVAPIAALIVTAVFTNRALQGAICGATRATLALDRVIAAYLRSKRFAAWLLGTCGMFASACLLVGHRNLDLALAILPLAMLLVGRPSIASLVTFIELARTEAEDPPQSTETR